MFRTFVDIGVVRWFLVDAKLEPWMEYTGLGICLLVCLIVPYLLGQLNFAIILSKKQFGVDIRNYGSGNGGTTNMLRTFGKKSAIITLGGDMGKAVVACLVGYIFLGRLGAFIAGLFCILGHTMPIKYKFKGGKGVACVAAVILMTDLGNAWYLPITFFVMLTMFALIALGLKFVSLASVMCMLVYPLMMHEMEMLIQSSVGVVLTESGIYTIIALMMALLIVFMHRENIKRLLNGTESKLDLKGKKKTLYAESVEENATQKTTEAEDEIAEEPTKAKRSPNPDRPNPNTSKKKQKRNKK